MENAKKTRNDTWPSPVANTKTATQHVTFSGGTHKKQPCNNVLRSPVVHTKKQSRNNALPSPVVNAKNSHSTMRCLHRWYTEIVTQRYVALTGENHKEQHQNNRLPSPAEDNNSHARTKPKFCCCNLNSPTPGDEETPEQCQPKTKREGLNCGS